jgi:hypothetical protein
MPRVQISIKPNKRYTFFGKTRSGKSFLAWYMLRAFSKDPKRQIIFIDAKFEHKQFGDGKVLDFPKLVKKYDPKAHVQIIQTFHWTADLDAMVDKLLLRGNAIVVLDELGGIADAHSAPKGIIKLWTQGGGKGVGAWAMLQTCSGTPSVIKKQTEMYFMFKMNDENERKDIVKYIPDKRIVQERLPLHYFWLFSDDMDAAIKCKPIKVPERKKPT